MRVLLITETAATGVGRHVRDLASALVTRGIEVHLLHSADNIDNQFVAALPSLRAAGVGVGALHLRHTPHWTDLAIIGQIRRYIRRQGPFDVVHCHSTKAGLVGRLAAIRTGAAIIYTPHALLTMALANPLPLRAAAGLLEWVLARVSDRIIAVSECERDHAASIGLGSHRIQVVPNGICRAAAAPIRESRSRLRTETGLADHDLVVGFVGRLVQQKALHRLIDAIAQALPACPHLHLAVVGNGPLEDSLRTRATNLGIGGRIRWLGPRDGADLMPMFDVFALPSDYEGFPYVLLEAASAGLPIIATDVGGARDVVRDHVTGRIVPVGSVAPLAAAITELTSSRERLQVMGTASLAASQDFTLDKMVDAILDVYQQSCGRLHSAVEFGLPTNK